MVSSGVTGPPLWSSIVSLSKINSSASGILDIECYQLIVNVTDNGGDNQGKISIRSDNDLNIQSSDANINLNAGTYINIISDALYTNCSGNIGITGNSTHITSNTTTVTSDTLYTNCSGNIGITGHTTNITSSNNLTIDSINSTVDITGNNGINITADYNAIVLSSPDITLTTTNLDDNPPSCNGTASSDNHIVNKGYLDTRIGNIKPFLYEVMTYDLTSDPPSNQAGALLDMSNNSITNCTTLGCTGISYPDSLLFTPTDGSTAPPSCANNPYNSNHLVNVQYLVDNYIHLGSAIDMDNNSITNCTTLSCTGISYGDNLTFSSTATNTTVPPSCSYTPTEASHLVNVQYLVDHYTPLPPPSLFSINENLTYSEGNSIYIPNNCVNGYTAFGTDENSVIYLPETVTGGNHIWVINQHTSTLTVETQGTTQIWNNGTTSSTITKEGFGTLHFIGLNDNWICVN